MWPHRSDSYSGCMISTVTARLAKMKWSKCSRTSRLSSWALFQSSRFMTWSTRLTKQKKDLIWRRGKRAKRYDSQTIQTNSYLMNSREFLTGNGKLLIRSGPDHLCSISKSWHSRSRQTHRTPMSKLTPNHSTVMVATNINQTIHNNRLTCSLHHLKTSRINKRERPRYMDRVTTVCWNKERK